MQEKCRYCGEEKELYKVERVASKEERDATGTPFETGRLPLTLSLCVPCMMSRDDLMEEVIALRSKV